MVLLETSHSIFQPYTISKKRDSIFRNYKSEKDIFSFYRGKLSIFED